jgi:hypothetical protein
LEPVPGVGVDRAKLLAERAWAAEEGHEAIEDQLVLTGAGAVHGTEVVSQAGVHANAAEAGIEAVVDNTAVLVKSVREELASRAGAAAPPAQNWNTQIATTMAISTK